MSYFDRFIPYQLDRGWSVMDRDTGEIVRLPDGEDRSMPYQWALNEAKQFNEGEILCKVQ